MPTYKITDPETGRTVKLTGDSPPTEAELTDIFKSIPQTKPKSSGYDVPSFVQKAAQVLTTPIRGFRGLGVGAQRLMQDVNPSAMLPIIGAQNIRPSDISSMIKNAPMALQRAAEAVKPGFVPQPGEKIGSALGETAATAGLMAPLAAIAPASIPIQSAIGAASGGGLTAAMDASEEGRFHPLKTGLNAALGGTLPLLGTEAVRRGAAKVAGSLGRIQSGVEQKFGERLYKDPGAFLSSFEEEAGKKLGASRAAKGLKGIPTSVKEIVSPEAGEARKYVEKIASKNALSKLGRAEPVTPSELLKTKQSLNKIIEVTPMKQRGTRAELFELKSSVEDLLEKVAKGEKAASLEYSRSALAGKFRKFLPVTKGGDISLTRTIGIPALESGTLKDMGMIGAAPLVALQSPFLGGSAIAAAGGVHKVAQSVLRNPAARTAIQSAVGQIGRTPNQSNLKNPVIPPAALSAVIKYLTKAEIKQMIKDAPGDTIEEKRANAKKEAARQGKKWQGQNG